jgi:hypothetical protein
MRFNFFKHFPNLIELRTESSAFVFFHLHPRSSHPCRNRMFLPVLLLFFDNHPLLTLFFELFDGVLFLLQFPLQTRNLLHIFLDSFLEFFHMAILILLLTVPILHIIPTPPNLLYHPPEPINLNLLLPDLQPPLLLAHGTDPEPRSDLRQLTLHFHISLLEHLVPVHIVPQIPILLFELQVETEL